MNRPLIIGIVGAVIVAAAIALNFVMDRGAEQPPPASVATAPSAPSTGGTAGGGGAPAAAPSPSASLEAPKVAERPVRPSFDVVRVNPRGDAVIAGRAAPNAEIVVRDGGKEVGRAKADARGEWVLVPEKALPPGSRELVIESRDASGKTVTSDSSVVLVVPERGKDIAGRPSAGESGPLALRVPRDGGPTTVLQKPDSSPSDKPKGLGLDAVDYDEKGSVSLSGTAEPGSTVGIYANNKPIGTATADEKGRWTVTPDEPLAEGHYKLRVDQIGKDAKVVARIETPFQRAAPLTGLPKGAVVFVQPGNSLWRIARRTYGTGVRYAVIFEANKAQIRDPDLIYPGQIFVLPKVN